MWYVREKYYNQVESKNMISLNPLANHHDPYTQMFINGWRLQPFSDTREASRRWWKILRIWIPTSPELKINILSKVFNSASSRTSWSFPSNQLSQRWWQWSSWWQRCLNPWLSSSPEVPRYTLKQCAKNAYKNIYQTSVTHMLNVCGTYVKRMWNIYKTYVKHI